MSNDPKDQDSSSESGDEQGDGSVSRLPAKAPPAPKPPSNKPQAPKPKKPKKTIAKPPGPKAATKKPSTKPAKPAAAKPKAAGRKPSSTKAATSAPKATGTPKKRAATVPTDGDATEKRKRRKPMEVVSIIDDFPESEYIGQFTRAARFCKAVREASTVDPDGLLDAEGIPNYVAPVLTEEQEATILKAVTASQIRFSKKAIQFNRWLTQTLLRQSFDEHAVVNNLQKKATLCMDQVLAHQKRRAVCNMSTSKIVRDAEEDVADVCLENFLVAENGNCDKAWKGVMACAKCLKLDMDHLAGRATAIYGEHGAWAGA